MNDNLWYAESIARAQRERVQEEMKQIRLEEASLKSHAVRPSLLLRAWLLVQRSLEARKKQAAPTTGRSSIAYFSSEEIE